MHIKTMASTFGIALIFIFNLAACSKDDAGSGPAQPDPQALPANTSAGTEDSIPDGLLPDNAAPLHYSLHLRVDPREDSFSGEARIRTSLQRASDELYLHGRSLQISDAGAVLDSGESIALDWQQLTESGVVHLTAGQELPAGELTLTFSYRAPFNTSLEGLYRVDKGELAYAFTQFEATSARLAFPAFDQPGFKVPFDLKLTVPREQVGIANTPQIAEAAAGGGWKTLTFATTKALPSYLVAFAVGPFDVVEWEPIPASRVREREVPLRGITTRGRGAEIHYALKYTAEILVAMEQYFGTAYPYTKLDIIAVPDFASGAMENAGAITYREQLILLDESSAQFDKYNYFNTHAHELSHQWFGNLVTPAWWDDLWLKESFATWHAHITLDELYPDGHYLDALFNGSAWAMNEDSLASARRIREPIVHHEDIGAAYDGITYAKGGGVLAMFEEFLGRENLRRGIRLYMQKFAWKNTTADDFMAAITEANPQADGEVLQEAFRSFIEQAGVPVLAMALDCDGDRPRLALSQQRYLPLGSRGSADQSWTIPACITLFTESGPRQQCFIAAGASQSVDLDSERCPQALLPNSNGSSYYRFNLPGDQWQALLQRFDQLSTHEQISVAGSVISALNAGAMAMEDFLAAAPVIAGSDSWRVSIRPRDSIYRLLDHGSTPAQKQQLQTLLASWYRPQLEQLDALESLTPDQNQYRVFMQSTLALRAGDEALLQALTEMAKRYTGYADDGQIHPGRIDSNYAYIALLAGVKTLGKPFTELLWQQFLAEENVTLRERHLQALARSEDPGVAAQLRAAILSPEVAVNEFGYIISGQMDVPEHQQAMWQWMQENFDAVIARIPTWQKGQTPHYFDSFCSEEDAASVEAVFSPLIADYESGPRYLAKSLEKIRLCAAYVEHYGNVGS
ncbi:M1 family peptidase [Seongchinamella sediminis]|uniref:Aminopeptidase n=1 Tax=Seongchinamella sediminis TaxID=2283635 RepID=A0A3L7E2S1_9GAMM|nr:M1 family metallopeptidase [Seongchinamella sediminis]RLQ22641.1 M1 family peptidase [Seongchinamella sediminis]